MNTLFHDWSTVSDKKHIHIDGNRLHQLAKIPDLTTAERSELRWLLTGMATRSVAFYGSDERRIPHIVRHCLKKRPGFNPDKAQAFTYFTSIICNEVRDASGQSARYGCFDTATRTMDW